MTKRLFHTGFMCLALLFPFFIGDKLLAQNAFTAPVLYSISGASTNYSNNEGGTTTFGGTNNQKLISVTSGSVQYKKVPIEPPHYRIERNSVAAQYTGATFYAEGVRTGNGYNLVTTRPVGATGDDVMISIFKESQINSGEDNIFNNITSDATYNNIERLDFIFPGGNYVTDPQNQGFIINERGGNDNFKVVIVQSVDASNRPSSYFSTLVNVPYNSPAWSVARANMQSFPFRNDPQNSTYAKPVGTTPGIGAQDVAGILFKFADFNIAAGTTVYGIWVTGDSPNTPSDWLMISNFPTNTAGENGGLDFTGITGMYNKTVTLSGTVFRDANGATSGIGGTGINTIDGAPVYVYLIDINGEVYEKQQPAANGVYSFSVPSGTVFMVKISTENIQQEFPPTSTFGSNNLWVNTGEQFGTNNPSGSGIDAVIDGSVQVTTNFTNNSITNVNFAVQKKPVLNNVAATASNPGGTLTLQAPTLAGTDEDGSLGAGFSFKITSLPVNAILYYNGSLVSLNQVISNYQPNLLRLDPTFDGVGSCAFNYTYTDAAGSEATPASTTLNITGPLISGTVFNDANGGNPDGTGIGSVSSQQLYAYLVDGSNNVYEKTTVAANGTYTFSTANQNMNFTLAVSTTEVNVGNAAPASANLPAGWYPMQDVRGTNNGAGTGADGTPDLRVAVNVGTANLTAVNFGLNREPQSNDASGQANYNRRAQTRQVPLLTGSDPESGPLGANGTIVIKSLPTGVELWYIGTAVTVGQVITNYTAANLAIRVPGEYTGTNIFTYAFRDAAGLEDQTPATVTMKIPRENISGTVYFDPNGATGDVNGTASGIASGVTLYAYLVNTSGNIVERTIVAPDGDFGFTAAQRSTSYTTRISTSFIDIGQAGPSSANLPANWVAVGESYGTNNTAGTGLEGGTPNMQIATNVNAAGNNLTDVLFGYQQRPITNAINYTGLNPGGTTKVTVPTISGTDAEDGAKGSGNPLRIVTLPTNAALYYNGSLVAANQIIPSYNPALLTLDPQNGSLSATFTVAFQDNAATQDFVPATVSMNFGEMFISGSVLTDANGLIGGITGTGVNSLSATPLYAYLLNTSGTIVEKSAIKADGTYSFINAQVSTSYTVSISTSSLTVGQTGPASANLPGVWSAVGDLYGANNGAGTTNDGNPNLTISVTTGALGSPGVSGVNFGVQQAPSSNDVTASLPNPGGTTTVQVPALSGADPEDGAKGTGSSFKITSLPSNASLLYNGTAVTLNQVISSYNPALLRFDPSFNGTDLVSFTYATVDNAGTPDPTPNTVNLSLTSVSVSGIVVNDANGASSGISGAGMDTLNNSQLFAYLCNTSNIVLKKVNVATNGEFTFTEVAESTNYSLVVSATSVNLGQTAPANFFSTPGDWVAVGDDRGVNNSAGTGLDASANAILAVNVTTLNVSGVKIGFDRRPESFNVYSDQTNPGGTTTIVAPSLAGSDPEDGAIGSTKSFRIKTLPGNASLYYNNALVTVNQLITNYNPNLLKLDPTFTAYGVVSFTFAAVDAAGLEDLSPATMEITMMAVRIVGKVFRDANGLSDAIINGSPLYDVAGSQLYAYLVSTNGNVFERELVEAAGTYFFRKADFNTSYTVVISTSLVNVGSAAPTSANLPLNWLPVADSYGTNNAAGTGIKTGIPQNKITVTSQLFDIEVVYFAAQPRPVAHSKRYNSLDPYDFMEDSGNPAFPYVMPLDDASGTSDGSVNNTVSPGKLSGVDEDEGDYAGATGTTLGLKLVITVLPVYDDAVLRYNNGAKANILLVPNPTIADASYTYWNSSSGVYAINNFDPTALDMLYKHNYQDTITFEYAWVDNAEAQSESVVYYIDFDQIATPLPISLLSFTAHAQNDAQVYLNWISATEINSNFFEIERSANAFDFYTIGKVKASGNSNSMINYDFVDNTVQDKIVYYRLKMLDYDGSFEYSDIRKVVLTESAASFTMYPNPVVSHLTIQFENENGFETDIRFYTLDGHQVFPSNSSQDGLIQIDMSELAPGVYMVVYEAGGARETKRLIKL